MPQNGVCTPNQGGCPRAHSPPHSRHGDLQSTTNSDQKIGVPRGRCGLSARSCPVPSGVCAAPQNAGRSPTKKKWGTAPQNAGRSPLTSPRALGAGVTQEGARAPRAAEGRAQATAPSPWQTQPSPLYFFGGGTRRKPRTDPAEARRPPRLHRRRKAASQQQHWCNTGCRQP